MDNLGLSQQASDFAATSHTQRLTSPTFNNNTPGHRQDFPSCWRQFTPGVWCRNVDVRDFIQQNYHPYDGDASFLASATDRSLRLWRRVAEILEEERKADGLLAVDTETPASITAFKPGYIDKDLELIVGLQTDAPRKRAMMPRGGIRTVIQALESYGQQISPEVKTVFTKHTKTHNDGVFSVYTKEMLKARSSGVITGLPDAYGRGRIIGDYRRVALYGTNRLIAEKKLELASLDDVGMTEDNIRLREELSDQIASLNELHAMAKTYGFDISLPAQDARQAIQWLYFGYLAAIKEQDGAAMSLGRVSTFLDIYFERDMAEGILSETEAQELIDDFVIKLRLVCFLRPPAYNALFSGDPTWVTEAIGGIGLDGRSLVTKSSFRMLQTLRNLGAAPEPNLTVLWSQSLPEKFKRFATEISIETSSVQYQNDDMMRQYWGDDYAIACCVSAMRIGKQMQFFGARANLAKALLYAINGGRDELSGEQVTPLQKPITSEVLDYNEVQQHFDQMLSWLAKTYVNTLNVIHYMHDRYNYERLEMALHDRDVLRTMACGIAGLSVVVDSLSAIKYAQVRTVRNKDGLVVDYHVDGDFPKFGNGDARVDVMAAEITELFMNKLRQQTIYRQAMPTQSVLTITSNVVYGQKTGNTPDGRKTGEPFAPGANPMHGRDTNGAVASMLSVASIPYNHCQDGISYTFSIIPKALGRNTSVQVANLVGLLDGYFGSNGHHVNVNVFNVETLKDAMANPEKYPQLTIRVSGYAVNFIKLSREQQLDVISRTIHASI